jgi:hypothetical protein
MKVAIAIRGATIPRLTGSFPNFAAIAMPNSTVFPVMFAVKTPRKPTKEIASTQPAVRERP